MVGKGFHKIWFMSTNLSLAQQTSLIQDLCGIIDRQAATF